MRTDKAIYQNNRSALGRFPLLAEPGAGGVVINLLTCFHFSEYFDARVRRFRGAIKLMAASPAAATEHWRADGATMMDEMARRKQDEIPERDGGGVFIGRYERHCGATVGNWCPWIIALDGIRCQIPWNVISMMLGMPD